jgi:hypothetical protein
VIKIGTYLLFVLLIGLTACSPAEEDTEVSLESGPEENSYEFKDGEKIHWEAEVDGDFIIMKAWLNKEWNTYSVFNTNFLGPLPTLITFDESEHYELVGDIIEEGLDTKFDEESQSEIGYFSDIAIFKQKIKINSGEEFVLKGNVNYIICNATMCLPPADYNFELTLKP